MRGGGGGTLERGGAGGAVPRRGGRPLGPARPGDLAAGEGSRGGRGGRDDRVRGAVGREAAGPLQRRGPGRARRPATAQRDESDDPDAGAARQAAAPAGGGARGRGGAGPPADGGLWTSRKVAAWMAEELGLASVAVQRGWEALRALGWSVQVPRPEHPARAPAGGQEGFKKSSPPSSPRRRSSTRARSSRSSPRTSTASG